ncbi:RDD family protein [Galbitalea sp. SE-J8]|uniref:RDD family protein n=1 Tax=Galbitalea sp. SE-J8 TaxID=3054952 RepID=UPI00259CAC2B|nr:RDD family protein [Galbitalea sp. SE-J8]MDM4764374.1 RDD family protein [Galbitalea sp. SE-J8]
MTRTDDAPSTYPGERLGLPPSGPRSIGRLGRRVVALVIDWAIAEVLCLLLTRPVHWYDRNTFVTYGIFALLQVVFIATASGSIGHLIAGLRVVPVRPAWVGVVRPVVRTLLVCLVVPAVIWDRDQRGVHDKAAGTLLVRR